MKKVAIIIAPNWRDYAKKYLRECVDSLRRQNYGGERKIFLADNETSPESASFINSVMSEAELVLNKNNDGFAKGNNDCIRLALAQNFDYIFLVNMDTVIHPVCVRELVEAFEKEKGIGAVQARLMLWPEKDKVNSLGNNTHFLGFGFGSGYKKRYDESALRDNKEIFYPSGAAVMFKKEILEEIGLFDEEFWMYNEDQDIGWRVWLSGRRCVLAPKAIVYHKYEFSKSIRQYYWMDRNRIIAMIKNYHLLTLLLLLPAFVFMELGLIFFAWRGGWLKQKMKVYAYFLRPSKWAYLYRARKETQSKRKIKDKDIIRLFASAIDHQEIDDWKMKAINPLLGIYWKGVKKIWTSQ